MSMDISEREAALISAAIIAYLAKPKPRRGDEVNYDDILNILNQILEKLKFLSDKVMQLEERMNREATRERRLVQNGANS